LDEEHVVAVLPHQEEDEGGGGQRAVATHLRRNGVHQCASTPTRIQRRGVRNDSFGEGLTSVAELMLLLRNPVRVATWQEK